METRKETIHGTPNRPPSIHDGVFYTVIGGIITGTCLIGSLQLASIYDQYQRLTALRQSIPPADNPSSAPIPELPPSPTSLLATRPPTVPPTAETIRIPANPFRIGPLNFEGNGNQPADPMVFFMKLPDGRIVKFHTQPKALSKTDKSLLVYDPKSVIDYTFLNVTGRKNGYFEGFVTLLGHSGTAIDLGDLPFRAFQEALEYNGRPFTASELARTIDQFKGSEITVFQGKPASGVKIDQVDESGRKLINPVRTAAKIRNIIRLNPTQTQEYERDRGAGSYLNVMDYVSFDQRVSIDPQREFVVEFCGERIFSNEVRYPKVPAYLTTRYLVIFTLSK